MRSRLPRGRRSGQQSSHRGNRRGGNDFASSIDIDDEGAAVFDKDEADDFGEVRGDDAVGHGADVDISSGNDQGGGDGDGGGVAWERCR